MKWHRIEAVLLKFFYISVNRLDRIFDLVYWPFMGLLIWGFITFFVKDISSNSQILNIFLGGAILWTFYQRSMQDMGVFVLEDFWSRNVTNLLATPLKTSEFTAALVLFGFFRSCITFFFLTIIALVLFSFNIFSAGILAVVLFSFTLLLMGWFFGIFVTGIIFRFGHSVQVFAWSIPFLLQPFSAVLWPVSSLPLWLQKVSLVLPSTHAFEGMRYAFETGMMHWGHFWYAFFINIILLVIAFFWFKRSIESAKRTGILTKLE